MKNFKILILTLIISSVSFAQKNADITYSVIYNKSPLSEDFKTKYPEYYEKEIIKQERTSELTFNLQIDNNESLFTHPLVDESDQPLFFAMLSAKGEYVYYNNLTEEKQIEQFPYWGEEIIIENTINKIPWEITEESKKIQEYTCIKATKMFVSDEGGVKRDVEVVAWFTPQIPLKFGPKNYVGLPGLIMELQENHLTYFVKELNFDKKNKKDITVPNKGTKMTWEEFAEKSPIIKRKAKQALSNSRG